MPVNTFFTNEVATCERLCVAPIF